jgi:replicative DNA helicase
MSGQASLWNVEAESAVLGAVLIAPDETIPTLTLKPEDFYIHKNRYVWEAVSRLSTKRVAVDVLTLSDELERSGHLQEIGGPAYLTSLTISAPSSLNAEHYAGIVQDYARRRQDVEIANLIAKGAYNGGVDRAKVIELLTTNTGIDRGAVPVGDLLGAFYSNVEERSKNPKDVWGIPSGLPTVDKATGGWQSHTATMIAGSPGVGKTTLLLQVILEAAKRGHNSAIYELEMDNERLIGRIVSMLTGVPIRDMKSGRMENHWENFNRGIEILERLPLYISDNPVMNSMQVRADVARLKNVNGIELIGLDYLNLLTDKDNGDRNGDSIDKAVRFRSICREFAVAGISVQSVTKEGMKNVLPVLADMSGPAEVGFTADNVFFLVQEQDSQTDFNLLPAKLRDGDTGRAPIRLLKPKGKILFGEPARY